MSGFPRAGFSGYNGLAGGLSEHAVFFTHAMLQPGSTSPTFKELSEYFPIWTDHPWVE